MSTAWPKVSLGEACEIVSGATPKTGTDSFWGGEIPWATPKDLSNLEGHYIGSTPRTLTAAGLKSCAAKLLPVNSVLLSSRAPIGYVAINTTEMATNQGFKSLIPKNGLDAKFLYWWLRVHRPHLENLGTGATFKEISKKVTARVEIPLPPIEEQRRIAAVLDAADALRAKRRQALAKLDTLTQGIFIDMFGSPGINPRGYPVKAMIEIVDPDRPITYGILKPGEDMPNGVPYVRVVDMMDRSIRASGLRRTTPEMSQKFKRSVLKSGDIVMSIRGHVGRLALVNDDVAGANITQDTARLAVIDCEPAYVHECLRSLEMQRWMAVFTKGAAVKGINLTDVKKIPVPLPPLDEQTKFARSVDTAAALTGGERTALGHLDTLFASLQQRAFRGEL